MITDADMERALKKLASTDEREAQLYSEEERAKEKMKAVFSVMMSYTEGRVADKEAAAYQSDKYTEACNEYWEILEEHRKLVNNRRTLERYFEAWRSLNANRRQGGL